MGWSMTKQFQQRLLFGSTGMIGLALSIYYSYAPFFKPIFILLTIGFISLALGEYYHLATNKGFQPSKVFGVGFSAFYTIALALSFHDPAWHAMPSFVFLFIFVALFIVFFKHKESALGNMAITIFGIIYLTLPVTCALRINYFFPDTALQDGRLWLAYVLLVSKMTDIAAYFSGKLWGRTPLAPSISPKKTVEGALGGLSVALLTSIVFALFAGYFGAFVMSFFQSIWLGILISILAQLGDLSESLLKRDAGVKDSSHLPGLGGMLDIVDSLVFTLPLMYLFLKATFI